VPRLQTCTALGVGAGVGVAVGAGVGVGVAVGAGVGVGVAVGAGVGVAVDPGCGVGVIVGVGACVGVGPGVGVAAGTGVGVGTAVAVATGVGAPGGKVMNAVIDEYCPRARIVPVLALSLLTPLIITVDPATAGKAVTVMVESCTYSPNSSGAVLKTNMPFRMPKTVCPGFSGVPFTDNCIPSALGVGTIVGAGSGVGVGIGDGVNVGYGV